MNFPQNIVSRNSRERKYINTLEFHKIETFHKTILNNMKHFHIISPIEKLPLNVFPISQKYSEYFNLPYGKISTIGQAGCGPLAVEYALRFSVI